MADFIQKIFMTQKQRALFQAVDAVPVQMQYGVLIELHARYDTTTFSAITNLGKVKVTFAKQYEYSAMKPQDFYSVEVEHKPSHTQRGKFAKAMYKKLKCRYEQDKQRVR